jgi:hypothetical protein
MYEPVCYVLGDDQNVAFFASPEQVLRDFRGSVHQERPPAQVLTARRRLPIGLRQCVGVAGPPADQEGTRSRRSQARAVRLVAGQSGQGRHQTSSLVPPILRDNMG